MLIAIDIPDIDELPKSCRECPLVQRGEWYDRCATTDEDVNEHIYTETRPDWCSMHDIGKLVHDLYERLFYEYEDAAEEDFKSEVESLGVDLSDVHW